MARVVSFQRGLQAGSTPLRALTHWQKALRTGMARQRQDRCVTTSAATAFLDRLHLRLMSPRMHAFAEPGEMPGS